MFLHSRENTFGVRVHVQLATNLQLCPLHFLNSLIKTKVKTRTTCGLSTHLAPVMVARSEKREPEGRPSAAL